MREPSRTPSGVRAIDARSRRCLGRDPREALRQPRGRAADAPTRRGLRLRLSVLQPPPNPDPAAENVLLRALVAGHRPARHAPRVEELLGLVGLTKRAGRWPAEMTGSEQQRVAIARGCRGGTTPSSSWRANCRIDPHDARLPVIVVGLDDDPGFVLRAALGAIPGCPGSRRTTCSRRRAKRALGRGAVTRTQVRPPCGRAIARSGARRRGCGARCW